MKSPIHILHLEDNPDDAELVQSILEDGGLTCETVLVEDEEAFVEALDERGFDLMLADYSVPKFDGLSALLMVRVKQPDLPVIFVSGMLGEQLVIDSLTAGARDYILKKSLARLVPAVQRTLQEVEKRDERRQLEAQSVEGQKMEVIGQLAAGVAHDFNNILAVIIGYCELLRSDLPPASPQLKYAEEIRHASERAAGLTRRLLIACRKQTVQPTVLNLNDVMEDMNQMLRRLIDANIEMTLVPGDISSVNIDSGYVGQVLMNLVVNARDAMPYGGDLTIATADVAVDEDCTDSYMSMFPGDYVMLSVSDTGTGMTDEVKERLFEPLFTTKPLGKGTGLGLSTCKKIIHQSGGHISVRTASGKGTTFEVYLPRHEGPCERPMPSSSSGNLPRGAEVLLVVEDDPTVRNLACTVLEGQGYKVLQANNGQEGVRVVHEFKGTPIRLVVTDVIMPVMGGKAMADLLKMTNPEIRVLFTSGYSDETVMQHGVLDTSVDFMAKPYTPAMLARKVREMLDTQPALAIS
jgi:two-component system cell cycle sensor histidine kinase/response regulator CckA